MDRGAPAVSAARGSLRCWTFESAARATGRTEPVRTTYPNCPYCRQRPVCSSGPELFLLCEDAAPQWWVPPRRQQAGRLSSARKANTGLNSDKPMSASTTMAGIRRNNLYYPIFPPLSVNCGFDRAESLTSPNPSGGFLLCLYFLFEPRVHRNPTRS